MRGIWAVFKRELAVYFRSPIAYAVAFAVYFFIGLLFVGNLIQVVAINTQLLGGQGQQFGQQPIPATVLFNATQLITFLMFLIGPLLTMRLIAEENREGTLEVLMTLPMNESSFVIGKFLAVWGYYTILLALTVVQVFLLSWVGALDAGTIATSYLGAWLYGGAALAVCMIWSATTEDQVIAAFLGATTILVLYLSELGAEYANSLTASGDAGLLSTIFRELSLTAHYGNTLAVGLVRAHDILYFVLMIVGALFITTRIVETRRYRG
ncbi:MAG: ABC transporter permease [Chloroflexota bacterium]